MDEKLRDLISEILKKENLPDVAPALREIPFEGQLGLALSNVFQIARVAFPDAEKKELKAKAAELADLIAVKLEETGEFVKVESVKGYVNCFIDPGKFGRDLVERIIRDGTLWGKKKSSPGKAMVEYSQPNTHKAFHIGHVRNAVTGASLVRCFRYAGHETLAVNYYGDIGSHVFKSLWYLLRVDPELETAPENPMERGRWLGMKYQEAQGVLDESQEMVNKMWDAVKPALADQSESWSDDDLISKLGIENKLIPIALNEEDLFENRPGDEISELIESLYHACIKIAGETGNRGSITKIEEIAAQPDFEEIWNRRKELSEIAERWNSGDKVLTELWEKTKAWSFDDFYRIYGELGAEFDVEFTESEVETEGLKIVKLLEEKNIVTDSKGAKIVEIDKQLHEKFGEKLRDKYRVAVLVRADGASLYGSKDLALAKRKFEDYGIDESIYVVGNEQRFYFQQLFQILRLMGFRQWEKCFHLAYELVMLPGGKISSRKGQVVLYDDVSQELTKRALEVVNEKNASLDDETKDSVAGAVAKGALIYGMLRVDTNKKIEFDFDEVLDFNGRSAPYIQYACARANSIFRKAKLEGIEVPETLGDTDFSGELQPVEVELVKLLARFPDIVTRVVKDKKPIHLASYVYDLAVAYSDFYHQCPVLNAEENVRRNRLLLVKCVRITLEAGLGLLGIDAPDVM